MLPGYKPDASWEQKPTPLATGSVCPGRCNGVARVKGSRVVTMRELHYRAGYISPETANEGSSTMAKLIELEDTGGGGLPPVNVIEPGDGGSGGSDRDDDWIMIANAPPVGYWLVELRPGCPVLNWEGHAVDVHKLPDVPLVVANCSLFDMVYARKRGTRPKLIDEHTFNGRSKWSIAPLSPTGMYAVADDGSLWWSDDGNSDPPPVLPKPQARTSRRKLRTVETAKPTRNTSPRDYESWLAEREARRNAAKPTPPRRRKLLCARAPRRTA